MNFTKALLIAPLLFAVLNLTLARVLSVVESTPVVVPVRDVGFARTEAATTPIEPSPVEVRVVISLRVEVR